MRLLAESCQQIEPTRFELAHEIIQSRLRTNDVIVIGEDHHPSLRGFNETIATSRQSDVIFGLNESIDQRCFVRTGKRGR